MPILAVDKYGRLYTTGRDRSDGRGYSGGVTPVNQTDLTLGSAYLRSAMGYQHRTMTERQAIANRDRADEIARRAQHRKVAELRQKQLMDQAMYDNDTVKRSLIRRALQMGCDCPTVKANERQHASDRHNMAVQRAVTGMGADVIQRITKSEAQKLAHEAQAAKVLAAQAFRDAIAIKHEEARKLEVRRKARELAKQWNDDGVKVLSTYR